MSKVIDSVTVWADYLSNPVTKAFFDHANTRGSGQVSTSVERAMEIAATNGVDARRPEVVNLFKLLSRCNCGTFVWGRRRKQSRIIWNGSLSAIASLVLDLNNIGEAEAVVSRTESPSAGSISHCFYLRPDLKTSITLPQDFTAQEAERLAGFIKTLPMSL